MAHQPFGHAPRSGSVANRTIRILGVLCLNQYQGGIYAVTLGRLLRPPRRTFLSRYFPDQLDSPKHVTSGMP